MQTNDADNAACLTGVPGRLRIRMPGLYRSQAEKERIEARLATCDAVISAYANPLTARVLILFKLSASPADIFGALGLPVATPIENKHAPDPRDDRAILAQRETVRKTTRAAEHDIYPPWHLHEADAALRFHQSSLQSGLSSAVVSRRLSRGLNLLPKQQTRSRLEMLFDQFKSLPVLLLGVSAALSIVTGGVAEAVAIIAVLGLNGAIGFTTERRAESTIASLSELIDDVVPVLRDGKVREAEASHIAVGDILALAPGIRLAADARLVHVSGLTVDESSLTGESMPVAKTVAPLTQPAALAERSNMVYRGTAVASGAGLAMVVGTGSNTEIGTVQALMTETEHPKTPIQKQLDQLGNQLVTVSAGICIGIFGLSLLRGYGWLPMLKAAISLAIAAVPEGLPAVATTSLARGVRLMRDRNVLIRRLHAVETIGVIHTICLDKTGTLTMNRMSAVAIDAGDSQIDVRDGKLYRQGEVFIDRPGGDLLCLLDICVLCNQTELDDDKDNAGPQPAAPNGSATESALIRVALQAGAPVRDIRHRYPLLTTELRSEGRNYMRTVHAMPDAHRLFIAVKGSPLEVLAQCNRHQAGGRVHALSEQTRKDIVQRNEQMAERRLRVLGFAYADIATAAMHDSAHAKLIWVGLVGLADPLRSGAENVIEGFHRASIRTVMVTGDQSGTAHAIGQSLRLNNGEPLRVLNAEYIEQIDPDVLRALAKDVDIFARVSPSHKLHIVQALRDGGHVVAMTGDGINDGPALRAADIGIAMGHGGTDLARSAADIILKDDRLETLLEAISQGRTISANIGKSLHFLISSNLSEILLVLASLATGSGHPLTPMQLLWINLLSDVLPAIALAAEPSEGNVMQSAPRDPKQPLVGKAELKRYAREASYLAGGGFAAYFYARARYGAGARAGTMAFNSLILGQLMHAVSCRSDRHRIFSSTQERNRQMDLAIAASFALQLCANVMPGLSRLLGVERISASDVLVTLAGAAIPLLLNEAAKKMSPDRQVQSGSEAKAARQPARQRTVRSVFPA